MQFHLDQDPEPGPTATDAAASEPEKVIEGLEAEPEPQAAVRTPNLCRTPSRCPPPSPPAAEPEPGRRA